MSVPVSIPPKIFLIGLMGSGKSYWGRQLAARFRVPFLDLDKGIEMAERSSVAEIFTTKGEAYFRASERDILTVLARNPSFVMSCGGGTPCFFNNMALMKQQGKVVWLKPPIETLASRLMPGRYKRPLLHHAETEADIIAILNAQMEKRAVFYEQADYTITNGHPSFENFENELKNA